MWFQSALCVKKSSDAWPNDCVQRARTKSAESRPQRLARRDLPPHPCIHDAFARARRARRGRVLYRVRVRVRAARCVVRALVAADSAAVPADRRSRASRRAPRVFATPRGLRFRRERLAVLLGGCRRPRGRGQPARAVPREGVELGRRLREAGLFRRGQGVPGRHGPRRPRPADAQGVSPHADRGRGAVRPARVARDPGPGARRRAHALRGQAGGVPHPDAG